MRTHHTTLTLVLAIVVAAVPATSFAAIRLPVSPLRLPAPSSSSSSVSSSESNSSSSAAASAKSQSMSNKINKSAGVSEYCMAISIALVKADKVKVDEETMKKVDQTVDLLTKAQAICMSMGFTPPPVFIDSSFSSSEGFTFTSSSSSFSSSANPFTVDGNSQLCTLLGKAGKRGGVQFCRYDCSGKTKVMACK